MAPIRSEAGRVLQVVNLTVTIPTADGEIRPVDGLTFAIDDGEIVGVVGESGSGKSMTALAIAQLVPFPGRVTSGSLLLRGEDLLTISQPRMNKLLGTQLAMVFQDPGTTLNPALRIGPQLVESARSHAGLDAIAADRRAVELLREVYIPVAEAAMRRFPHEFSGGQRQRCVIAMALMSRPALIIADEPTTALDVTIQAQVIDLLREVNRKHGTAIMLISHNIGVVAEICSRVLVMYAGHIVEDLDIDDLLRLPAHPYTQALVASVPMVETDASRPLKGIPGQHPSLRQLGPGCPFQPRCPAAIEQCSRELPRLDPLKDNHRHRVACWVAHKPVEAGHRR